MKMNLNLSAEERHRMGNANIDALANFLEDLMDNPDKISSIPDGEIVILTTDDEWVNEQMELLKAQLKRSQSLCGTGRAAKQIPAGSLPTRPS